MQGISYNQMQMGQAGYQNGQPVQFSNNMNVKIPMNGQNMSQTAPLTPIVPLSALNENINNPI